MVQHEARSPSRLSGTAAQLEADDIGDQQRGRLGLNMAAFRLNASHTPAQHTGRQLIIVV